MLDRTNQEWLQKARKELGQPFLAKVWATHKENLAFDLILQIIFECSD